MRREESVSASDSENMECTWLVDVDFLVCISDELDVFRLVSQDDNRSACIASYKSKMPFVYTRGTESQEDARTEQGAGPQACPGAPGVGAVHTGG